MSQNLLIKHDIPLTDTVNKKWRFLQYAYRLWQDGEFVKEPLKIHEARQDITHSIYTGISEMEFVLYVYFIEVKDIVLRGRNADCVLFYDEASVELTYYDKFHRDTMNNIFKKFDDAKYIDEPNFDFKMYFYIPEYDSEFYYQLISFIYYMSEVNAKEYGLKICDRKGNFKTYNSLDFPYENLDKFLYYDGNIFIGSHSQDNMIVVFNLPKNRILELRRWCNEYKK